MRVSVFFVSAVWVVVGATPTGCGGGSSSTPDAFTPDLCDPTQLRCDDQCFDVSSNPDRCGDCTTMCPAGVACESGMCGGLPNRCPAGEVFCPADADCFDLSSNVARCGSCTNACGTNEVCIDGRCGCAPGFSECNDVCVDLKTDVAHCNGCNTPCAGACVDGVCNPPEGDVSCGASSCDASIEVCCIDVMNTDSRSCAVGSTCPPGFFRRHCDDPSDCGGSVCCGQDNQFGALCPPGGTSCGVFEELCSSGSDCPVTLPYCCPSGERRACHSTTTAGCN